MNEDKMSTAVSFMSAPAQPACVESTLWTSVQESQMAQDDLRLLPKLCGSYVNDASHWAGDAMHPGSPSLPLYKPCWLHVLSFLLPYRVVAVPCCIYMMNSRNCPDRFISFFLCCGATNLRSTGFLTPGYSSHIEHRRHPAQHGFVAYAS